MLIGQFVWCVLCEFVCVSLKMARSPVADVVMCEVQYPVRCRLFY